MRPFPVIVGAVGVAFVAVVFDEPDVRYAAGTVATAALVGWVVWAAGKRHPSYAGR